jgi:hypothetical protein
VDLTKLAATNSRFTFYAGYLPRVSGQSEILRIYVSTDCGNSFSQVYERSGNGLQYNATATATPDFVPSQSNHWKRLGLSSLAAYTSFNQVIFKVSVISQAGNPVYLDNINISEWYAGTQNIGSNHIQLNIYPNPVQEKATIELNSAEATAGNIALYDMAGKKVLQIFNGNLVAGLNRFEFGHSAANPGAVYLLKIATSQGEAVKAVTFAP